MSKIIKLNNPITVNDTSYKFLNISHYSINNAICMILTNDKDMMDDSCIISTNLPIEITGGIDKNNVILNANLFNDTGGQNRLINDLAENEISEPIIANSYTSGYVHNYCELVLNNSILN